MADSAAGSRLQKAEAYAQMCEALDRYHTTENDCRCPDWQIRGVARREIPACKHQLALRLRRAGAGLPAT